MIAVLRNEKGDDPEELPEGGDVMAPNDAADSTGDSTARPLPFLSTFDGISRAAFLGRLWYCEESTEVFAFPLPLTLGCSL